MRATIGNDGASESKPASDPALCAEQAGVDQRDCLVRDHAVGVDLAIYLATYGHRIERTTF